jgi:hypothetical protein
MRLHGGPDAGLVDHHVHVPGIPQGGEDPPSHAKGGSAVVILLDRIRQRQREAAGVGNVDHGRVDYPRPACTSPS